MKLFTPRLVLRDLRERDLADLFAFDGDPEVQRFEGPPLSEAETRWRLEGAIEWAQENPRTRYKLGVTVRPSDQVIGRVSLTRKNPGEGEWEIGWTIRRADWGKGYATEAARAVLEYALTQLGARRVVALCLPENAASIRVMEKLGMRPVASKEQVRWIDGAWRDEITYVVDAKDFLPGPPR